MQRSPKPKTLFSLLLCLWLLAPGCEVRLPERDSGAKEPAEEPAPPTPAPIVVAPELPPEKEEPQLEAGASPYLGKRDAKVTLIVFSEFQCPYCAKAAKTMLDLRARYGGELRIVWKDMPLTMHKNALPAAIAARAVLKQGTDKFFAMHDLLFQNQAGFKGGGWTPEQFERFAGMVPGINIERWRKDLADPTLTTAITNDQALAKTFGVVGTPTFFINGEKLKGARSVSEFITVIERQKIRAESLLSSGISGEDLYTELVKTGFEGPGPKPVKGAPNAGELYKVPVVTPTP